MPLRDTEYGTELATALDAALDAGRVVESLDDGGRIRGRKRSFNDVVTEADERCGEAIERALTERFPNDGILTEESVREGTTDRVWVVDPIDGTSNFVRGFEYYGTSIALRVDGRVVVGVVLSPPSALGRLYFGVVGEGAYLTCLSNEASATDVTADERLSVSEQRRLRGALIASKVAGATEEETRLHRRLLAALTREEALVRVPDAGALECARTAEGVFDGAVSGIEYEWDYLAGKLLVEEAGGTVRDRDSVFAGQTEVVATNGAMAEDLAALTDRVFRE